MSRKLRTKRGQRALITDAQRSPEVNRRSRESQYLVMQALRVPFVLLSIATVFHWHNWALATVLFLISVPLPWIAVMIANGQGEVRDTRARNVYKPAAAREAQRAQLERNQRVAQLEQRREPIIDHDDPS